jgi:hypothetical protein
VVPLSPTRTPLPHLQPLLFLCHVSLCAVCWLPALFYAACSWSPCHACQVAAAPDQTPSLSLSVSPTGPSPFLPISTSFLLLCPGARCRHSTSSGDRPPCRFSTPKEPQIGCASSRHCSPPGPCPRRTDELLANRLFLAAHARCRHHESSSEHHFPTTAPSLCLASCAPTLPDAAGACGAAADHRGVPVTGERHHPRAEPPPHQRHPSTVKITQSWSSRCKWSKVKSSNH